MNTPNTPNVDVSTSFYSYIDTDGSMTVSKVVETTPVSARGREHSKRTTERTEIRFDSISEAAQMAAEIQSTIEGTLSAVTRGWTIAGNRKMADGYDVMGNKLEAR